MRQVSLFSVLILAGLLVSQLVDLASSREFLTWITMICLSYIMIHVGLEFDLDKKNLKNYRWDYVVAMTAAAFPWVFCAGYFVWVLGSSWTEALLLGRFAAPTSAGILFTMLLTAGLGASWMFKKVRTLAIFDDLDTIILMIPLKMMMVGLKPELFWILAIIFVLLWAAYQFLHSFRIPVSNAWILIYAIVLAGICSVVYKTSGIHLEVLLPAFVLGCVIRAPHGYHPPTEGGWFKMDVGIKAAFMFLVGCSIPKMEMEQFGWVLLLHVLALTLLSNLGKCFPTLCYRNEASLKERFAVTVAMFPRGEVGAGVLLVSIGYGVSEVLTPIAGMSLALNLLLTPLFIQVVLMLLKSKNSTNVLKP